MSEVGAENPEIQESTPPSGGWRSQSPLLKALLFVSLVCVVFGVYRCSAELAPSDGPRTIRIERATVAVPDSLIAVSPDSTAALATRLFARSLRGHGGDVTTDDTVVAWVVVRLSLGETADGIELTATATSALSGRRVAFSTASDTPDRLREMTAEAAAEMWDDLGAASDLETGAR